MTVFLKNKVNERKQETLIITNNNQVSESNQKGTEERELKPVYRLFFDVEEKRDSIDVWLLKNNKVDEYDTGLVAYIPINLEGNRPCYIKSYNIHHMEKIGYKMQPPIYTPILDDEYV